MWLKEFKVALVRRDTDALDALLATMPTFTDKEEAEEAAYLLREAYILITSLQDETKQSMSQIQKNIQFLKSTQTDTPSQLDLTL